MSVVLVPSMLLSDIDIYVMTDSLLCRYLCNSKINSEHLFQRSVHEIFNRTVADERYFIEALGSSSHDASIPPGIISAGSVSTFVWNPDRGGRYRRRTFSLKEDRRPVGFDETTSEDVFTWTWGS